MLPLVPPTLLCDIALEHYRKVNAVTYQPTFTNTDRFSTEDALAPDPVYFGLRSLIAHGPIGALVRAIDRRIEAREERRFGASTGNAAPITSLPQREQEESDRAA
jgi:hypothetical protein